MLTISWLALGFLLGAGYLALVRRYEPQTERQLIALGLVVAALIYVTFAIAWGDDVWLLAEILGVTCYGLVAWFGLRFSGLWLAVGWGAHPLWDALLHLSGSGANIAPTWYVVACISFDILVGVYVLKRIDVWVKSDKLQSTSP